MPPVWCAMALRSTSASRRARLRRAPARRLAVVVRLRRQELRRADRRGVEVLLLRQGFFADTTSRRRRRSRASSTSARRSARSIRRSCRGRSATPSAGSSTTSSPCSTSACSVLEAMAADYALTAPDDQLYTNPGYVEAWQKVLDLKDAGCFQDAPNATSPEATRSMFAAPGLADDLLRHLVRQHLHRRGLRQLRDVPLPGGRRRRGRSRRRLPRAAGLDGFVQDAAPGGGRRLGELPRLRRDGGEVRRVLRAPSRPTPS